MTPILRTAACHAAPVFLSARQTTEKCVSLIREAARIKANLVIFPESFVPGFPAWSSLRPPTENHDLFKRMAHESIYADGEEVAAIRQTAKECGIMVSLGLSEKVRYSSATLFNSNVFIDTGGEIIVHHRKLMPTFFEKLIWGPGDGHGLRVADTPYGKIGALICGENTNPLARYSLMAQGEQVHISTWPAAWPTRVPKSSQSAPEATPGKSQDSQSMGSSVAQGTNYDNVAANRTRAAAHCFEAKCFGVLCSSVLDEAAIEIMSGGASNPELVKNALTQSPRAATMFLDPNGTLLPGFTADAISGEHSKKDMLQAEEGILYADLDLEDCIEGKQYHDVVGGYQRLDVFDLKVDRSRRQPVTFTD